MEATLARTARALTDGRELVKKAEMRDQSRFIRSQHGHGGVPAESQGLRSVVTSMQPGLTYFGEPTSLTPVHTGWMRGSRSQTRNLVVSIYPHPSWQCGTGALAHGIPPQPVCLFRL